MLSRAIWSDRVGPLGPGVCARAVSAEPNRLPTTSTRQNMLDYEIRQGVLDLVFSILKAQPTIGRCHDREGKVLHVLQPQSVFGRTFGNLVLQLGVLFFQLCNQLLLLEDYIVEVRSEERRVGKECRS